MEQKIVAPPRPRMPDLARVDFADPAQVKAYLQSLNAAITAAFEQRPAQQTAVAKQLYRSPDGTAYEMTVDDAGAPVFTKVGTETAP